jgi:hypothetical protein
MICVAIFASGNYAFSVCRLLEKRGFIFEVAATPCQISRGGCGYCLKFPSEYTELVINEGITSRMPVMEIYRIVPMYNKNKYEKIY